MCVGKWATTTTTTERCKQRVCLRGQRERTGGVAVCLRPVASCCCYAHTVAFCYCFLLIVKWVWRASVKRFFSSSFSLVFFFFLFFFCFHFLQWGVDYVYAACDVRLKVIIHGVWNAEKGGRRKGRCIKEIRKINKSTRLAKVWATLD